VPILTIRPPVPSYLPLLMEGGGVATLTTAIALLGVVLAIALNRRSTRRRLG